MLLFDRNGLLNVCLYQLNGHVLVDKMLIFVDIWQGFLIYSAYIWTLTGIYNIYICRLSSLLGEQCQAAYS
jgi:hypothetical protein